MRALVTLLVGMMVACGDEVLRGPLELSHPAGELPTFPVVSTESPPVVSWTTYGSDGYSQRAAVGRCSTQSP